MTDQTAAPKAPRAPKKDAGPKYYVVTSEGKRWLIKLDDVRVASQADLNDGFDGKLQRASLTNITTANSGRGGGA